jgi:hypothetical protein
MPRSLRYVAVALALAALGGCGEGYEVKPAILDLTVATEDSKQELATTVSSVLKAAGFEDLGRYDEMIALTRQNPAMSQQAKEAQLARLNRERTFLNESRQLRIVWADYTNAKPAELALLRYTAPMDAFVEISIYNGRSGGFGADAFLFYSGFLSGLRDKYGAAVVVAKDPPPTNAAEYRRITTNNAIATILSWFVALLLALLFTGLLSVYLLKKLRISNAIRRIIFVLFNTWLVAPLPFQGGFIFVFPGPNLIAFPWTDWAYYSHVASYAAVSFPCALVVCTVVSTVLFKGAAQGAAEFRFSHDDDLCSLKKERRGARQAGFSGGLAGNELGPWREKALLKRRPSASGCSSQGR